MITEKARYLRDLKKRFFFLGLWAGGILAGLLALLLPEFL